MNETAAQHENKGECDRQIGLNYWMGFHTVKCQNGDKAARFLIQYKHQIETQSWYKKKRETPPNEVKWQQKLADKLYKPIKRGTSQL